MPEPVRQLSYNLRILLRGFALYACYVLLFDVLSFLRISSLPSFLLLAYALSAHFLSFPLVIIGLTGLKKSVERKDKIYSGICLSAGAITLLAFGLR